MTVINTQQATPLITLAGNQPMHAVAQVPGAALDGLAAGQPATVTVNGKRFDGKLDYLAAEADNSGQYTLTFSFDPGKTGLRAGLPARVEMQ
jgi:multidrug resistance efflux pump